MTGMWQPVQLKKSSSLKNVMLKKNAFLGIDWALYLECTSSRACRMGMLQNVLLREKK